MERDYKTAVFIGRFQPFHNSHLDIVKQGLEIADKVVVVVGSSHAARSFKNPFSFDERKSVIEDSVFGLTPGPVSNVEVVGVRDYYYNMQTWLANVQAVTESHIQRGDSVALLGSFKDASSFYLRSFPQWDHVPARLGHVHATDLRRTLYEAAQRDDGHILTDWEGKLSNVPTLPRTITENVPVEVCGQLAHWVTTSRFADLAKAWKDNEDYKKLWESSPFPPTFVTTDAIVVCSGHVLVVKRKFHPGKGLFALPGGFLKERETIQAGALRELKEETGIRVDKLILESLIKDKNVFDHPDRSVRGRTITHGFYIKLNDGTLPEVKGNDDAEGAFWMPLWDVAKNEDKFFEDHAAIIHYFTS